MAVPISNVTRRQVYAPSGAGGAGPYAFTFEILANTDIAVYKDDVLLTLTTHYTVTINANGTGSVTITATGLALAPTSPTQYAIVGNRTISRTTDFTTGGDFFANTLNDELDQQTIFNQQNAEGLQRALAAPQTDPTSINMTLPRAALRANKALGFDANGNPVISDTLGTNRGNWSAGVLYYARDIVKDTTNNNIWQCLVQHTSSGSQPINTNADSAKWSLLVDAASATTSASNAASSASAASTSASNASTSASNASTSASNASTSASNAASSASAASTSASNAAASYDSFDDRYLGSKSSAPSVDNDGNSLLTGALYWDTVANQMRVWSGTAWVNVNASASNTRTAITATAGQTVLTVATYTPGTNTMVVYVNGVKLNASEYTETNSTTVTVTTGLALNDEVEVFSYRVNEIGTLGASSVTIADTGNYYAGGNVETALQEAAQASTTKFIAAGTGAVTRTTQDKMREVVSANDYSGASVTAKLNAALTAAGENPVLVPADVGPGEPTWNNTKVLWDMRGANALGAGRKLAINLADANGQNLLTLINDLTSYPLSAAANLSLARATGTLPNNRNIEGIQAAAYTIGSVSGGGLGFIVSAGEFGASVESTGGDVGYVWGLHSYATVGASATTAVDEVAGIRVTGVRNYSATLNPSVMYGLIVDDVVGNATAKGAAWFKGKTRIDGDIYVGVNSATHNTIKKTAGGGYVLTIENGANTSGDLNLRLLSGSNTNAATSYPLVVSAGTTDVLYIRGNGNVINANNSYGAISDIKVKENITDVTPKLDKLKRVRIVNFNMIGQEQKQLGVIAQELEQIFPGMIDESPDRDAEGNNLGTTTKSVKYSVFVPMLIKGLQEQQALIEDLTTRIQVLEANSKE